VKFLVVFFMILKVKRWMVMSSLVENNVVEFRTTFQPVLDQDGFLINQDDLVCREITDLSLMVIRT